MVKRVNENKFDTTRLEFSQREDLNEHEVKKMLGRMKDEYTWIMQTLE
jgi:hypothetical protein